MADGISEGGLDLFGLPLLPERGRGRPAHVWTLENSNKVNILFACGRKPIEVARALGISKPTFYKVYFNEIERREHALLNFRGTVMARLMADGSVAALKAVTGMVQAERIAVIDDSIRNSGKTKSKAEPKAPPIGKKEAALTAAGEVDGIFATRNPPPQLMN